MNVVVVVMDSLRADHIYGRRARTPVWDKAMRESLRFTRAYPEAMPTIPARRSVMSGQADLPLPRLAPLRRPAAPAGLGAGRQRRQDVDRGPAGQGLDDRLRHRQPAHPAAGAQAASASASTGSSWSTARCRCGASRPARSRRTTLDKYLPPSLRGSRHEPRMKAYLAGQPARPARGGVPLAARVHVGDGLGRLGAHAPAVRARGRLVRRPRAVGRARSGSATCTGRRTGAGWSRSSRSRRRRPSTRGSG